MSAYETQTDVDWARETAEAFARVIGTTHVPYTTEDVGDRTFLKFEVGRNLRLYDHALRTTQKSLAEENPFRGLLGLTYRDERRFAQSLEAELQTIMAREARPIGPLSVSDLPFQNREDQKVIQPANQLIVGRRGVGKSTLIAKAARLLESANKVCVFLNMEQYSELSGDSLYREVLRDFSRNLADKGALSHCVPSGTFPVDLLRSFSEDVAAPRTELARAIPDLNRLIERSCAATGSEVFLFLDDYDALDEASQPELLDLLHGAMKGAGGWLKVAGFRTRLKPYDPGTRKGLQRPDDAQEISLDFTLVDPETAEKHLRAILEGFLSIVGVESIGQVIHEPAFRRLVWANAGVPRDFLQAFGNSLKHARRAGRAKITLTDVNLSIGESGQHKMDDMEQDARNEKNVLKRLVGILETFCLEKSKVNAFLVRSEQSDERRAVEVLSDLRLVHLIHQTITPHRAGERYEAYLLDYSLFTGLRRRPNVKELLPADGRQFKAKELRKIPELPRGVLSS